MDLVVVADIMRGISKGCLVVDNVFIVVDRFRCWSWISGSSHTWFRQGVPSNGWGVDDFAMSAQRNRIKNMREVRKDT